MSETVDSSLVCAGPHVSVATTGTNCFVCRFDSCEASVDSSGAQAGQLTSGVER